MTQPALDWEKMHGLIPAIVQDESSGAVLMMGYMNREALAATTSTGRVTFWSRSKNRLWTKGESSGHVLEVSSISADCDRDTLLILGRAAGPACHLGTATCWGEDAPQSLAQRIGFLGKLERIVAERLAASPEGSYTAKLAAQGINRVAQKVGEEGLELALAAVSQPDQQIIGEAADLLYHTLVLLNVKGLSLAQVIAELASRHSASQGVAR
jgi:phosphoribosyl-ATP pyrophosphohydrolase/phosphoribosyl-AMP cyclohydrolase